MTCMTRGSFVVFLRQPAALLAALVLPAAGGCRGYLLGSITDGVEIHPGCIASPRVIQELGPDCIVSIAALEQRE